MADNSYKGVKHDVPARNEARVLLEVDVIPNGTTLADQRIGRGVQKMICYASELPAIEARVVKPEALAAIDFARDAYEAELAELLAACTTDDQRAHVRKTHPGSPQAKLEGLNPKWRGGVGSLRSVKVLEQVPPPATMETLQANQFQNLANTIADAIARAGGMKQQRQAG